MHAFTVAATASLMILAVSAYDVEVSEPAAWPGEYAGLKVPEALISGDHARIKQFRTRAAMDKCRRTRPDLLARMEALEDEDN